MIFEGLASSRTTPPMTDAAGALKHNSNIKKQLRGLWAIMFPRSTKYRAADEERRQQFIKERGMYQSLKKKILAGRQ